MTVSRPLESGRATGLDAPTTGGPEASAAGDLFISSGSFDAARDAIVISMRAGGLMRAGLAMRACLIETLVHTRRVLVLASRTIVLEAGIYR